MNSSHAKQTKYILFSSVCQSTLDRRLGRQSRDEDKCRQMRFWSTLQTCECLQTPKPSNHYRYLANDNLSIVSVRRSRGSTFMDCPLRAISRAVKKTMDSIAMSRALARLPEPIRREYEDAVRRDRQKEEAAKCASRRWVGTLPSCSRVNPCILHNNLMLRHWFLEFKLSYKSETLTKIMYACIQQPDILDPLKYRPVCYPWGP